MSRSLDKPKYPECLNKNFFEETVKNGLNLKNISVEYFNIENATSTGDNYFSEIYRVKITYRNGSKLDTLSVVIKSMEDKPDRKELLDNLNSYDKERDMFCNVLPKFTKLLNNEMLASKCYYATPSPYNMIVFEDLKTLGYSMANRHELYDLCHCELVLEKLGKLHAVSMVYNQRNPDCFKNYDFGFFEPNDNAAGIMVAGGVKALVDATKKWKSFEKYSKKLEFVHENVPANLIKITQPKKNDLKVLLHGDVWINNHMFKFNGKKPTEVVFVDYQVSFFASPGLDLNYFLHTSIQLDLYKTKKDDLIKIYYKSFSETLKSLNSNVIPTLDDIRKEVDDKKYYGLFAAMFVLPLVLMEKQADVAGIGALANEQDQGKLHEIMYNGTKYVEMMKYFLPMFDEAGVLDYC